MKWITRDQIRVNRTATCWLIRRFLDEESEFIFVPAEQVESIQTQTGATGFDAPGATYPHKDAQGLCSFAALVRERLVHESALLEMARIVQTADIQGELDNHTAARGLQLIGRGFPLVTNDDFETTERAAFVYDALYASIKKTPPGNNDGRNIRTEKKESKMKKDRNMVRRTLNHSLAARKTRIVLLSVVALAVATLFVLVACSAPQNQSGQSTNQQPVATDWKPVVDVFGFPGDVLPEGVIRFNMPRKDLHVTVGAIEIKPALALGAWAAFRYVGQNDAMVMGDLVLTEGEVDPVMKALEDGGVEVTALHNHLIGESPRILYIHMGGHGDPVKMARTIKQAIALTKSPLPQGGGAKESEDIGFDVAAVEKILGQPGKVSGGVLHVNVARAEKLTEEGMDTPPSMGMGISINFQPTGNRKAAIAGDYALIGEEVGPVMKVLRDNGVQAVALHSHALNDVPRLFYMHFWANDDALKLAHGIRAALDKTNLANR